MARIGIEETLTSAGVGIVDVMVGNYLNDKNIGPLSARDATRFGLAIGSWLVNYMGYERDFSEVVFYSSLPLVVDSIANIVQQETAKKAASTAIRVVTPPPVHVPSTPSNVLPP